MTVHCTNVITRSKANSNNN